MPWGVDHVSWLPLLSSGTHDYSQATQCIRLSMRVKVHTIYITAYTMYYGENYLPCQRAPLGYNLGSTVLVHVGSDLGLNMPSRYLVSAGKPGK